MNTIVLIIRIVIIIAGIYFVIRGIKPSIFIKNTDKAEKEKKFRLFYILIGSIFIIFQIVIIYLRMRS